MNGLAPTLSRALDAIRPHPHRGDVIAAGVLPLTVGVVLATLRFDSTWQPGAHLLFVGLPAAFVALMALLAPLERPEGPRPYHSVLLVCALALTLTALARLAEVLGSGPGIPSGTVVWVGTLFALAAAYPAVRRNSAACTLLVAVTVPVVAVTFVDWVFQPADADTFRYVLLITALGYVVVLGRLRDSHRRHAVQVASAAGLMLIAIAFTLEPTFAIFPTTERFDSAGTGWEAAVVAGGFALIAYAAVDREPGPAYVGAFALASFLIVAFPREISGASLVGWPLALVALGIAGLAIGLRPRRELPPEPGEPAPVTRVEPDGGDD